MATGTGTGRRRNSAMSEIKSKIQNPKSEIGTVAVEAVAWVTQFVGGDGTRRKLFEEAVAPGATVRSVLRQGSDSFPKLDEVLWQRPGGGLAEPIGGLVEDAGLGIS